MLGFTLYKSQVSTAIMIAAFLATFSVYTLNKVTDQTEDAINRPETSKNPKYYLAASITALFLSLGVGLTAGPWIDLVLITPLIIGIFYSIKLTKKMPRLKEIVGVKSILVAFSWAFTGSILPALTSPVNQELIALFFIYIFINLLVNTILFDGLDLKGDKASGVKTIPLAIGIRNTKKLLITIHSLLIAWLAYTLYRGLFTGSMPALIFGVAFGYLIIEYFMNNHTKRLRAELLIDGEWIPIVTILKLLS